MDWPRGPCLPGAGSGGGGVAAITLACGLATRSLPAGCRERGGGRRSRDHARLRAGDAIPACRVPGREA